MMRKFEVSEDRTLMEICSMTLSVQAPAFRELETLFTIAMNDRYYSQASARSLIYDSYFNQAYDQHHKDDSLRMWRLEDNFCERTRPAVHI
jgi:hypothetical protein